MAGSSAKLLQQEGTTRETPLTIGLQRFGLKSLSPAGARARLTILIYHRVLAEPDELLTGEVDARHFDSQMTLIKRLFNVLPLDDAVERLKSMTLPERAVAITFDDGYADNAKIALPILRHHRLPATFFIATGFLERGRMFNDSVIEAVRRAPGSVLDLSPIDLDLHDISNTAARRQTICRLLGNLKYLPQEARLQKVLELERLVGQRLPEDLMMTGDDVRMLHREGMGIGAHTISHPILCRIDDDLVRREIEGGRKTLESIIGEQVTLFAYPNGKPSHDYLERHVAIVRELGFRAAVTTAWGAASADDDLFQLPRFTPWDRGELRFSLRLARNLLRNGARISSGERPRSGR